MASSKVGSIGEYIREQRTRAKISLRQLADVSGISNPYLSQIERGLRKPSAEILQQIARGLRISAEALYVQAGILEDREADTDVQAAVRDDLLLTERQKQVLLDIYASFLRENELAGVFPAERTGGGRDEPRDGRPEDGRPEGKATGRKATGDKTAGDKTAGPASNGSDGPERAMPNKSAKRSAHQSAKQAAQRTQSEQDGKEEVG
ncbi:helix-turn-helix protein [Actinomadura hallensis]|uniref:Helix-turn-helix protein n=1 Tax=Actinomadura hallensis TaxID=337895 RepID=A0A543I9U5_9ACTN|nr:helix-turn-helix transcriptional regulator [Actinomadura hallensis]TQM67260.1 helix-turn-helix protein [Actinomadura hallensis]